MVHVVVLSSLQQHYYSQINYKQLHEIIYWNVLLLVQENQSGCAKHIMGCFWQLLHCGMWSLQYRRHYTSFIISQKKQFNHTLTWAEPMKSKQSLVFYNKGSLKQAALTLFPLSLSWYSLDHWYLDIANGFSFNTKMSPYLSSTLWLISMHSNISERSRSLFHNSV